MSAPSPLDLLLPYQRAWVDDPMRFKLWLASRQIGKSFTCAAEAVRDAFAHPGTMWMVLSAGERQALEFMEKAKEWTEAFKLVIQSYAEDRDGSEALIKSAEIRWGNGSRMMALPANPSTARGYSANLILDEFAFHDDPDRIWRGIYPSISNPLRQKFKLRVVSTANGRGNKFFDLWDKPNARYSKHKTTIYDAVAGGVNGDVPADEFITDLREGLDDPEGWAQEFECEFLDGSNVLLPYELIALAESSEATEACDPAMWGLRNSTPCDLGIDFGRQHDPTVCWALQPIADLLWTREVLVLPRMDTPDQVNVLRSRCAAARRVCLDYTGPGVGLGDYLVREFGEWDPAKHKFGKIELCTFTTTLKREMFPNLRRKFEAPTRLRIPISRAVREDLHAMQQVVTNGQYNYWAPRTKDGHSDRCTALALAVRAAGDLAPFAYQSIKDLTRGRLKNERFGRRMLA